jgi:hypothetical protein
LERGGGFELISTVEARVRVGQDLAAREGWRDVPGEERASGKIPPRKREKEMKITRGKGGGARRKAGEKRINGFVFLVSHWTGDWYHDGLQATALVGMRDDGLDSL